MTLTDKSDSSDIDSCPCTLLWKPCINCRRTINMFPHRRSYKIIKNHKKQLFLEKSKNKEIIKQTIVEELKIKRSRQDKLNNVENFLDIYKSVESKKRKNPKKKIVLQKVSFGLHKCLTEIFTNEIFQEKNYWIVGGIKNQKVSWPLIKIISHGVCNLKPLWHVYMSLGITTITSCML